MKRTNKEIVDAIRGIYKAKWDITAKSVWWDEMLNDIIKALDEKDADTSNSPNADTKQVKTSSAEAGIPKAVGSRDETRRLDKTAKGEILCKNCSRTKDQHIFQRDDGFNYSDRCEKFEPSEDIK